MTSPSIWFVDPATQIRNSLFKLISPETKKLYESTENFDGHDLFLTQIAVNNAPEPVGLAHAFKRLVYSNPEILRKGFAEAVERGWLYKDENNAWAYRPSDKGIELVEKINAITRENLAAVESLPADELEILAVLMEEVVTAADQTELFEEKHALKLLHATDPPTNAPIAQRARQPILHLLAYRDDAHIAAWTVHKLEGCVLESLTYLWRGDGYTAAELNEKLSYRNYEDTDYGRALDQLADRNWAYADGGVYKITSEGGKVRDDIEDQTNKFFDAPFKILDGNELQELQDLLNKWAQALQPAAASA